MINEFRRKGENFTTADQRIRFQQCWLFYPGTSLQNRENPRLQGKMRNKLKYKIFVDKNLRLERTFIAK